MAAAPDDTVAVVIADQVFTGWKSVRISRSCEKMPPDFDIIATERNPDTGALALLPPGAPCKVMIGSDLVITGYIDRYLRSINPRTHQVQIQGRGKCEDLVDCSITPDILNGMQVTSSSLLDLANKVSFKFGKPTRITASSLTGDDIPLALNNGAPLAFNATLQETPYEILEKVARFAGVLIYEGTDGNLILANVGATSMASGFVQGVNVQAAAAAATLDERYSEYLPVLMSTNMLGQQGIGGTQFPKVLDAGVPRFRPLIVVSEQFQFGQSFAEKRAQWEAARRWGRSSTLHVTVDSWRDSAGTLWAPNAFAPIDIPALSLGQMPTPWVIGSVDFVRDGERGTVADLVLMPREAFVPQPEILVPWLYNPNEGRLPPVGGGATPGPDTPAPDGPVPGGSSGPPTGLPPAGGGATPTGTAQPPPGTFAPRYTQPGAASDVDAHE